MDLHTFVGDCYVARHSGDVTAADAIAVLQKAAGALRILIAGEATITEGAAK
jgi:arylformamidase